MSHDFFGSWRKSNDATVLDRKLVSSQKPFRIPTSKQFSYLPKILTRKEQLLVSIACLVFGVSVLFLAVNIYSSQTKEIPARGGTYTEAFLGEPQYVNPLFIQNNDVDRDLVSLIYSGLVRYTDDRKIVPDLAEKIEISPDGKVYTCTLRKNIEWHDGKPLSARDVVFTILKIQDVAVKSPYFLSFKDVKVELKDERTVVFRLAAPFAPFLDLMTMPIIPENLWSEIKPESIHLASLNLKPIGSGPWKFQSFKQDKEGGIRSYTLVRNEKYYNHVPFIEKMHIRFYADSDSALQALKTGQVDGVSFLPRNLRDRLAKQSELSYYTFSLPQYTSLFFNQTKNSDLESKDVRHALALALDKGSILKNVFANEGSVIHAPILENFIGYHPRVRVIPYDPSQAVQLLQSAGWKKNEQGHWIKGSVSSRDQKGESRVKKNETSTSSKTTPNQKEPKQEKQSKDTALHIILTTVQTPEGVAVAQKVKEYWTALGVEVDIRAIDSSQLTAEVINPRNYEVFLYGEIIGSDPDLYPFWHSSQVLAPGLNLSLFSNKNADALLEEGRRTSDTAKRTEVYQKFQDILAEELPALFLFNPSYNYVVSKKVHGITDKKQIVYPADRFIDLSSWYIKTKRTWKK